ncbi:MAG: bifunctional DNA primase/polymerase [Chloroflexota bacterium]|nr:MAG: hypothetical protein DLM70_01420 [Chloroflexota bacterium]
MERWRAEGRVGKQHFNLAVFRCERWPILNWGIACGSSGLLVIDVDPEGMASWRDLVERLALSPTRTVRTGSGGEHAYFLAPDGLALGNRTGDLPAGIHVRGSGGYVIAPGSLHKSGHYYTWKDRNPIAPFPPALLTTLSPPEPPRAPHHPVFGSQASERRVYVDGTSIAEGARNEGLFRVACGFRGRGLEDNELIDSLHAANRSRCRPPLPDYEVEKIAQSGLRYERGS